MPVLLVLERLKKFKSVNTEWHVRRNRALNYHLAGFFLLLLAIGVSSCQIQKTIPPDRQLLSGTRIEGNEQVSSSELYEQLLHKPNRKVLGIFRFHLRAYAFGYNREQRRIKNAKRRGKEILKPARLNDMLMNTVGEAPVLADTSLMKRNAVNLKNYLFNLGYFEAEVTYSAHAKGRRKKKAQAVYQVTEGPVFRIGSKEKFANDFVIDSLMTAHDFELLKPGQVLNFDILSKERDVLTALLRNHGFYQFNKGYIGYDIDTSLGPDSVRMQLKVNSYLQTQPHRQYKIGKVRIVIERGNAEKQTDTIRSENGVELVKNGFDIEDRVLTDNIPLRPGQWFNQSNVDISYSRLIALDLFKFINIAYQQVNDSLGTMDISVQLVPSSRLDFIWEPQLVSSEQSLGLEEDRSRNYGFVNNLTLKTRNVSGKADQFNINSKTSFETQLRTDSIRPVVNLLQNFTASYVIPELVMFRWLDKRFALSNEKTSFNVSLYYERNLNFDRNVLPFSWNYQFRKKDITWIITPWQLSFNRAIVSPSFTERLSQSDSLFVARLFANNLINGSRLGLYYTNRHLNPKQNWQIQANLIELAGNSMSAFYALTDRRGLKDREILGVKYFQFVRTDVDLRYYRNWSDNRTMALRFWGGLGLPYGNSNLLPFERRFFVGGSNGLRAWRPRTLGPGTYSDDAAVRIDKSGELMLQFNAEYRFDILNKYLKGALFVDAGNIWNLTEDSTFFNDNFKPNRFYRELAVNTGIGLRWDFDFFIFRMDWGIPLHDPGFKEGNRWVISDFGRRRWVLDQTILNIAVGYPF